MKEIVSDPSLVGYCGLYCGACRAYLSGRCPACHDNEKAKWCKIRSCCLVNEYASCADCADFTDPNDCKKFDNLFSRFFGLVFNSNRKACVDLAREKGLRPYAAYMAEKKLVTIRKFGGQT